MFTRRKFAGMALASTAAGLFAGATGHAIAGEKGKVECWGVNACKGKSDCKTPNSECKGENSCKGQGYVEMSREACEQIGGEIRQESG
ncbi:MAG TPA: hypothetical protein VKA64_04800 [Gammaproteobacteria bacterium]|nr:hypothetical protein [Gammaproteobacteria bacterium]